MAIYPRLMIAVAALSIALGIPAENWVLVVLWSLALPMSIGAEVLRGPERVELGAEGVAIYGGLRPKDIAWKDVRSVRLPGRWGDVAVLGLEGDREATLKGVDLETAQSLSAWIDEHATSTRE